MAAAAKGDLAKERFKSRREHIVPMSDAVWALFERLPIWTGDKSQEAIRRPVSTLQRSSS
ncbi:hypothetical protein [Mesorhizobium sp.]|uniref:hypothetical protein n=1 Tax=Mesorhizobium sp. TaxID=1871066 RepID=UPI0025808710|nr:hypothetical protein [Mesorhizobium sp.]